MHPQQANLLVEPKALGTSITAAGRYAEHKTPLLYTTQISRMSRTQAHLPWEQNTRPAQQQNDQQQQQDMRQCVKGCANGCSFFKDTLERIWCSPETPAAFFDVAFLAMPPATLSPFPDIL